MVSYVTKCSWEWPDTPALAKLHEDKCSAVIKCFDAFDPGKKMIYIQWAQDTLLISPHLSEKQFHSAKIQLIVKLIVPNKS